MGGADRRRSPEVPCVSSSVRVTRPFAIDVRGCTSILAPMSRRLSFSRCLVLAAAAAGLLAGASSCGGIVQNVDGSNGAFALGFAHAICDNIAPCCAEDSLAYDASGCLAAVEAGVQRSTVEPAIAIGASAAPLGHALPSEPWATRASDSVGWVTTRGAGRAPRAT